MLLSGPVAVGKSAVAQALISIHRFASIRSGPYLRELALAQGNGQGRADLQELGDELDVRTDYAWLVNDVVPRAFQANQAHDRWLLDCVRKPQQITHFRERYGAAVLHIHFSAPEAILRTRYENRLAAGDEYVGNTPYSVAVTHSNELAARSLVAVADLIIDLHRVTPAEAASIIAERCNGRANPHAKGSSY